jgi:hypothetical protein
VGRRGGGGGGRWAEGGQKVGRKWAGGWVEVGTVLLVNRLLAATCR